MIDPLFGKYCYIDTPWIAGEKTVYRIIRSGVRSNSWCEVPVNGRTKKVNHGEHLEEIVFVMLDTLIDEDTKIMRFALKDVEIIEMADRKVSEKPTSSENPNNCETCLYRSAPWDAPICDSCTMADSHYEKDEFAPKTEPQVIACPIQEEDADYARWLYEDEPQTERSEQ